jgi:hypothetical protein
MNEVRVNHKAAGRYDAHASDDMRMAKLRGRSIGTAQCSRQAMR